MLRKKSVTSYFSSLLLLLVLCQWSVKLINTLQCLSAVLDDATASSRRPGAGLLQHGAPPGPPGHPGHGEVIIPIQHNFFFQRRSSVNYLTLDNNVSNDFTTSSDKTFCQDSGGGANGCERVLCAFGVPYVAARPPPGLPP